MFVNRAAMIAGREAKALSLVLWHPLATYTCVQSIHAKTLWSCKVKKEDKVGAGLQKPAVNLS